VDATGQMCEAFPLPSERTWHTSAECPQGAHPIAGMPAASRSDAQHNESAVPGSVQDAGKAPRLCRELARAEPVQQELMDLTLAHAYYSKEYAYYSKQAPAAAAPTSVALAAVCEPGGGGEAGRALGDNGQVSLRCVPAHNVLSLQAAESPAINTKPPLHPSSLPSIAPSPLPSLPAPAAAAQTAGGGGGDGGREGGGLEIRDEEVDEVEGGGGVEEAWIDKATIRQIDLDLDRTYSDLVAYMLRVCT